MNILTVCRICLSSEASKDISNLKVQQSDKSCSEILYFCVSIQTETISKVSTKLCIKCFRKIMSFYNFKLLALKNDEYLKNLELNSHIKSETFTDENLKNEGLSSNHSYVNKIPVSIDIKLEPVNDEDSVLSGCQNDSDDELLSDIKKVKCDDIPKESETKENELHNNGKAYNKEKPKTHVCEECGKSVKDLKNHSRIHEPKDVCARVPCILCEKTFSSHSSKSKHMQKIHMGVKRPCPICKKEVKNLKQHTLRLHNTSELRYECVPCGKRFISASVRDAHMLIHTKDRPHACDKCDKRFRQFANLVHHKRQIHDKVETHLCQYCSKSFYTVRYLQRHLRIHSTERAYQCKQCDKAFKTSKALKNHTYTHSENRAYRCSICDMSFVHPGYLRAHTLTHTRKKQFPCKYCDVKFHRSDHRKRHEFRAHEKHLLSN